MNDNTDIQDNTWPIFEETIVLNKRSRLHETLRVEKIVHSEEQDITDSLFIEEITVERVPIDRWIEGSVPIRHEGDTVIFPVLEEIIVVEKRMKLVEEVRITKHRRRQGSSQTVAVRREEIRVTTIPPPTEITTAEADQPTNHAK